jgi:hypothetical protein
LAHGFEVQARQFLFRAPSLELRGASIHPGFAFGEKAGLRRTFLEALREGVADPAHRVDQLRLALNQNFSRRIQFGSACAPRLRCGTECSNRGLKYCNSASL